MKRQQAYKLPQPPITAASTVQCSAAGTPALTLLTLHLLLHLAAPNAQPQA